MNPYRKYLIVVVPAWIVMMSLLIGCETSPAIKTVDKSNPNTPASFFLQAIGNAPLEEIREKCEGNINGCIIKYGNVYVMYYTAENVCTHEMDHAFCSDDHN